MPYTHYTYEYFNYGSDYAVVRDAKFDASAAPVLPNTPTFNVSYRAYPDVAMAGHAFQVVNDGKVVLVDGTSAAAPLFAAMLSSLIADRLAKDPPHVHSPGYYYDEFEKEWRAGEQGWKTAHSYALGWLNPTLYANAHVFHDITEGNNRDGRGVRCGSGNVDGFDAAPGWDPVTGLGSITYDRLAAIFNPNVSSSAGAGCVGCDYMNEQHAE